MRTWARWTARTALFTASLAAAGITTAGLANAGVNTSGNHSIGGGNQVAAPVSVPVSACGNAVALLGNAAAGCQGGAWVSGGSGGGSAWTSGNGSILGGNQVAAPVSVPVSACGNAAAVLGGALAGCPGSAGVSGGASWGGASTSGNHSIVGGNQAAVPVSVPVSICGNAVGKAKAGCAGGASVGTTAYSYSNSKTSGNNSVGGGNQAAVPVSVPVTICGNAAAVLGGALAGCQGSASVGGSHSTSWSMTPASLMRRLKARHIFRQSAAVPSPLSGALAGLSKVQGLTNLPTTHLPILPPAATQLTSAVSSSAKPIQAHLLSAQTTPASAPGMNSGSLLALAAGALLAGAAALVAAGRRITARRAAR
jgi:ChpA-C